MTFQWNSRPMFVLLLSIIFVVLLQVPNPSHGQTFLRDGVITDESMQQLSDDLEELSIRGSSGYGIDRVTDEGIKHLRRCKKLRVLEAVSLGLTDQSLDVIATLTELEELSLNGNQIQGTNLRKLGSLKKLKKLNISFNPIRNDWASVVSQWGLLEELSASNLISPLSDDTLEQLSQLTKLIRLDLNEDAAAVTDRGLSSIAKLTRLKIFMLSNAQVTQKGLRQLQTMVDLETLLLRNLRSVSPGHMDWLPNLTKLNRLEISGVLMNNQDMQSVRRLKDLENLLIWSVSGPSSSSFVIDRMEGLLSLRALRTNETIETQALEDLSQIDSLEFLGDDVPTITDVELEWLSRLENLQAIYLDNANITEKSLKVLARMKSLRFLCVSDQVQITAEQWLNLGQESLTTCKIVSRNGGKVYYEPRL